MRRKPKDRKLKEIYTRESCVRFTSDGQGRSVQLFSSRIGDDSFIIQFVRPAKRTPTERRVNPEAILRAKVAGHKIKNCPVYTCRRRCGSNYLIVSGITIGREALVALKKIIDEYLQANT